MLRRSFAEFHAQRAQPELLQALEKGQAALARLHARPWPVSPLETSRRVPWGCSSRCICLPSSQRSRPGLPCC